MQPQSQTVPPAEAALRPGAAPAVRPEGYPEGRISPGIFPIIRKEFADHLHSWRFTIIALLVIVTGVASIYVAGWSIRSVVGQGNPNFVFLHLFTASDGRMPPFTGFLAFLGPLVGIALGFDAINGEQNRRTLSRLVAQPVFRDAVINGKWAAGLLVIALMVAGLGLLVAGMGLQLIGVPPIGEEVLRILAYLFLTVVYVAFWLSLAVLCSVVFRQTATSALAAIAVWLFFAVFAGMLSGLAADALAPVTNDSPTDLVLRNARLEQTLGRFSPAMLYEEATVTLLNPSVRSLGPVLLEQVEGAIPGTLPFGQSLLLIWPHFTGLIAATLICFAASYVLFMRREVRA